MVSLYSQEVGSTHLQTAVGLQQHPVHWLVQWTHSASPAWSLSRNHLRMVRCTSWASPYLCPPEATWLPRCSDAWHRWRADPPAPFSPPGSVAVLHRYDNQVVHNCLVDILKMAPHHHWQAQGCCLGFLDSRSSSCSLESSSGHWHTSPMDRKKPPGMPGVISLLISTSSAAAVLGERQTKWPGPPTLLSNAWPDPVATGADRDAPLPA